MRDKLLNWFDNARDMTRNATPDDGIMRLIGIPLLVILVLLFLTLPLASHALARAAYREMSDSESSDQ